MRGVSVGLALLLTVSAAQAEPTSAERALHDTLERVVPELVAVALRRHDLGLAEHELERALAVVPSSAVLGEELAKLERELRRRSRATTLKRPYPGDRAGYLAGVLAEAHRAIGVAIADAACSVREGQPERYLRYREQLRRGYPSDAAYERLGEAYYVALGRWVPAADLEVLRRGGLYQGSALLSPERVGELNVQHASWRDPWVLTDGVHELRTTVPLAQAQQILAYVGAYREFFLARFKDVWDLRPPKGRLPLIVTRTQGELQSQLSQAAGPRLSLASIKARELGIAFYLYTGRALDPCFVTYETRDSKGTVFTIPWEDFTQIKVPLTHELTHQLAFEYSKHAGTGGQVKHHYWLVEGIANLMALYHHDGQSWALNRERSFAWGNAQAENPLAYCQRLRAELPPLRELMGRSPRECLTIETYQHATALAHFLLVGEGGSYRTRFGALLQAAHQVRIRRDGFQRAFPTVELGALQAEFDRFLSELELE